MNAWPFAEMLQRVATPIVQAIGKAAQGGVLISTDRRDSFLGLLMQSCAAGATDRLQVVHTGEGSSGLALSTADGLTIGSPSLALTGRGAMQPRQTASLDSYAGQASRVFAFALDSAAVAACAWRGAAMTIARDRPVFVAYAQGRPGVLAELATHDYVVQDLVYWAYPQAAPLIALAVPREQLEAAVSVPPVMAAAAPKKLFLPHDLDVVTGFYPADTGDHGNTWIWSGPGKEGRIVLPTPWCGTGKLSIEFSMPVEVNKTLQHVALRINDKAVAHTVDGMRVTAPLTIGIDEFSGSHTLTVVNGQMVACPWGSGRWLGYCVKRVALEWF